MRKVCFGWCLLLGTSVCATQASPRATTLDQLWQAVCVVESGRRADAVGDGGLAVGIAQIQPVMVSECNRIVGFRKWTLEDRWSARASEEMFKTYCKHYGGTIEQMARRWNGGPRGDTKSATNAYWRKIQRVLAKRR